jgi:hypothetical protein
MTDRLVTIATFDTTGQAEAAKMVLEAAGIPVAMADENTVSLFWNLSNAVGGIKLQVREENAERAVTVIEREFGPDGDGPDEVDPEQLAAEAEAATPEDEGERRAAAAAENETPVTDSPAASTAGYREDCARRLFFVAWFGLVIPPMAFYALYLFLNAAFGQGELSRQGRMNLFTGAIVTACGVAFSCLILRFAIWP